MAKDVVKKDRERDLGYEEVINRLEEVVKRLEQGNLPLEESLKSFEEGVQLVRLGEARLNEAEKRVEQLVATPQGDAAVPFEAGPRENGLRGRPPRQPPEEPPLPDDSDIPF